MYISHKNLFRFVYVLLCLCYFVIIIFFAGFEAKLESMDKKIDNLSTKLDFFIQSNAEIKSLLMEVIQIIKTQKAKGSNTNTDETEFTNDVTEFNFPLRTTEDVDALEKKLADKDFQHKMVRSM